MLRLWLKQAIPLIVLLLVAMVLVGLGITVATYVALGAFLGLTILLSNRGPL
jgi:hypothetical protein